MKFDYKAYEKLYPRKSAEEPKPETAVEGFNPTVEEKTKNVEQSSKPESMVETAEVETEGADGGNRTVGAVNE